MSQLICLLQIEQSLDIASKLVSDCKAALEQIISGSENEKTEKVEKSKKGHVGDVLGKTLKNVSGEIKETSCRRCPRKNSQKCKWREIKERSCWRCPRKNSQKCK